MVNYKPITKQTRINKYLSSTKRGEFSACTKVDLEVLLAMEEPKYRAMHKIAVYHYNK